MTELEKEMNPDESLSNLFGDAISDNRNQLYRDRFPTRTEMAEDPSKHPWFSQYGYVLGGGESTAIYHLASLVALRVDADCWSALTGEGFNDENAILPPTPPDGECEWIITDGPRVFRTIHDGRKTLTFQIGGYAKIRQ